MEKYVVLKDKLTESGYESDALGYYDTEEEAEAAMWDAYNDTDEEERKRYEFSLGLIDEKNLENPGEWESFTMVDIITAIIESEDMQKK